MNNNIRPIIFLCFVCLLWFLLTTNRAEARDLVDAAHSAHSEFNKISVAALGIGISLGGLFFAFGVAQIGRMLLISVSIGAVAVLGGPAILSLLGRIFGTSL